MGFSEGECIWSGFGVVHLAWLAWLDLLRVRVKLGLGFSEGEGIWSGFGVVHLAWLAWLD